MVIGALFVFFSLIQPAYRESQEVKGQILSKENALKNEQSAATQVQNLLEQYRGDQSPQLAVSSALPLTNDQSEVVHQLQSLASMNQLAVQSIAVSQPAARPLGQTAPAGRGGVASTASLVKPVGVVSIQMRVSGPYASFRAFLEHIETNIRVTDVSAIVIAPVGTSSQDFYNFDLTLSTYYQSS